MIDTVRVFDSGIFSLAEEAPEKVEFLGSILSHSDIEKKFISEEEFKSRTLTTVDFIDKILDESYLVIDVRDISQREDFELELPRLQHYLVDRFANLLRARSRKVTRKKLLIIDNVGSQIRWLDYIMQEKGYKGYYFLAGGMLQWRLDEYDEQGILD